MIRHLKHAEIDKNKWDETLTRSFNGLIYAYSWYLDIVSPNWEALVEGDYQIIMPLPCHRKYGIKYTFPPFFTQQLGIFSSKKIDEDIFNNFIESIPEKFKFIELNLNSLNKTNLTAIDTTERVNCEMDLNHPYSELHKSYSSNLKRNLKKADKEQLSIQQDISPKHLIQLFRDNRGKSIRILKDRDYERLETLIWRCLEKDKGALFGVNINGGTCAAAFFAEVPQRSIFLFSGLNEKGKENAAMPFLIDQYIQKHAGKEKILDFEGSNESGLARFYKSFGARECIYLQIKINRLPFYMKWLKN